MVLIQKKTYNILLLGQTGAGKSMFINGFCNYVRFEDLKEALKASETKVEYCIPTTFPWYDKNDDVCKVTVGPEQDANECQIIGQSGTKCIQSYVFEFENITIRLIDTPGFGDTEGIEQDERICEKLITFLSHREDIQELHGIVFISKPQENRFTTFFKYCLNQIFSKLHKDASQNIIFVFTHTKATQYKPGPTRLLIEKVINETSAVVPITKENIFCVENDCIQFLFASFYSDAALDLDNVEDYVLPWKRSSEGYIRLLKYVKTLTPHFVEGTVRINELRQYSIKLEKVLGIIVEKIDANMKECEEYFKLIQTRILEGAAVEHLRYETTYINREGKYCVACYNKNCPLSKGTDKVVCCPNCRAVSLSWCEQMSFIHPKCKKCGCSHLDHTFERNEHNPEIKTQEHENIAKYLKEKQKDINKARIKLLELRLNLNKFGIEKKYIEEWMHKLRKYLNETSVLSDQQTYSSGTTLVVANDNITDETFSLEKLRGKLDPNQFEMIGEDLKKLFQKNDFEIPTDKVVYDVTPILDKWREILD